MGWVNAITITTTWQHYPAAQEIAKAIDDRINIIAPLGATLTSLFARNYLIGDVTGWPVATFVKTAQASLVYLGGLFMDPTVTLASFVGSTAAPTALNIDEIATLAGLTESGVFRRIPEGEAPPTDWEDYGDAAYHYGVYQDKDMAGPWLFKDMQLLLNKLTRWQTSTVRDTEDASGYVFTTWEYSGGPGDAEFPASKAAYSSTPSRYPASRVYTIRRRADVSPTYVDLVGGTAPGDTAIQGGVAWFNIPTTERSDFIVYSRVATTGRIGGNGVSAFDAVTNTAAIANGYYLELTPSASDSNGVTISVPTLDWASYITGDTLAMRTYADKFSTNTQAKALPAGEFIIYYEISMTTPTIIIDMVLDDQA